jgi:predicted membrane protein
MKLVAKLLTTFGLMVAVLLAVALLGGVGTVELSIWAVLLVVLLVVVGVRTRRLKGG